MEPARYFAQKSRQCLVHTGFQERYEVYRENLLNEIKNMDFDEILVTGHSLGAALATFCYMELSQQHKLKVFQAYFTFADDFSCRLETM